ncbi:MAG: hypothetical protein WC878_08120 [Candidatus Paceibacterota bacterium]|jgi:hypothetical protein
MPQELNKIWNAGKLFEQKPEQPAKQPESEPNPSTVKRKKSVIGAFMDKQEDPFKEKVEKVLEGVEETNPAPEPVKEEEKLIPAKAEVVVGTVQDGIGHHLTARKSIYVKGDAGDATGESMTGGILRIDGDVHSFGKNTFSPNNKGAIIWKGETIWQNGRKVEPGWTNLNVKAKIAK